MKFFIGFLGVVASVLGGYIMHGGVLGLLWQPSEVVIIAGGGLFAFVLGTTVETMKGVGRDFKYILKGVKYRTESYLNIFSFLYMMFDKARRDGMLALEDHVNSPDQSEIWQRYPEILADHHVRDFVCDMLRIKIQGNLNVHELEALMDIELDTHHHEAMQPSSAVQTLADALPAFGIVAAVMGVVVTMGFITEPPEILGGLVGAALVGTFLGVLLAYGFAGPIANALKAVAEEDCAYLIAVKTCLIADLQGHPPQNALEFGRKTIPSTVRPSFDQLDDQIREVKAAAKAAR
jgi:chemotaxis protein MotA